MSSRTLLFSPMLSVSTTLGFVFRSANAVASVAVSPTTLLGTKCLDVTGLTTKLIPGGTKSLIAADNGRFRRAVVTVRSIWPANTREYFLGIV